MFGTTNTNYYDSRGYNAGSSKSSTDMFGTTNTNYYDSRGYNAGSSKSSTDMFGNTKTDYYDSRGYNTGSSKSSTDMFGNTKPTTTIRMATKLDRQKRAPICLAIQKQHSATGNNHGKDNKNHRNNRGDCDFHHCLRSDKRWTAEPRFSHARNPWSCGNVRVDCRTPRRMEIRQEKRRQ